MKRFVKAILFTALVLVGCRNDSDSESAQIQILNITTQTVTIIGVKSRKLERPIDLERGDYVTLVYTNGDWRIR